MKYLILMAVCLTMFSCQTNEEKAQKLIKAELKKTLSKPEFYEPVNFSQLDSTFDLFKKFTGFKMNHTFIYFDISKNKRDNRTGTFFIDKDITKVLREVDTIKVAP